MNQTMPKPMGRTYTRLGEIIVGGCNVSADSAPTLGEALKAEPGFWLNLQRGWNLWRAMDSHLKVARLRKVG